MNSYQFQRYCIGEFQFNYLYPWLKVLAFKRSFCSQVLDFIQGWFRGELGSELALPRRPHSSVLPRWRNPGPWRVGLETANF